ncbi:hypothetical protein BDF21DRAFT_394384 [Thamnidium elegans]|nr:hypothetical protein BDF21DRAFT_394384 [Thamnidium elegans]
MCITLSSSLFQINTSSRWYYLTGAYAKNDTRSNLVHLSQTFNNNPYLIMLNFSILQVNEKDTLEPIEYSFTFWIGVFSTALSLLVWIYNTQARFHSFFFCINNCPDKPMTG